MPECFDLELKDGVAHLRMNRPEAMNTMTPAFWRELPALVNELSDAGEARVVVLSSTGKHFTAGMDLAVFPGGTSTLGGKAEEPGRAAHAHARGALRVPGELQRAREGARAGAGRDPGRLHRRRRRHDLAPATCATPPRTRSSASRRSTSA